MENDHLGMDLRFNAMYEYSLSVKETLYFAVHLSVQLFLEREREKAYQFSCGDETGRVWDSIGPEACSEFRNLNMGLDRTNELIEKQREERDFPLLFFG